MNCNRPLAFLYLSLVPSFSGYLLLGLYTPAATLIVTGLATAIWLMIPQRYLVSVSYRFLSGFIIGLTAVIASMQLLVLIYFSQELTTAKYVVLFESNRLELVSGIGMAMDAKLIYLLVFLGVPLAGVLKGISFAQGSVRLMAIALMLLALTGAAISNSPWTELMRLNSHPLGHFAWAIHEYRSVREGYDRLRLTQLHYATDGQVESTEPMTIVLVLGESTSRNHLGLYGYPLDTSPHLEEIAGNLAIFQDVISPHSHTIPVLKKSLMLNLDPDDWTRNPSILTLFRNAGYKTWWLSNQARKGLYSGLATHLGGHADTLVFTEDVTSPAGFDAQLVPLLANVLADPARQKFIVLHLMGNHSDYKDRYPQRVARFDAGDIQRGERPFLNEKMKRMIAEYDNAVAYNDLVVSEIIHTIEATSESAILLYLSDHGEEVFDHRNFVGHTESSGSRYMIEIPFILWGSSSFHTANPRELSIWQQASNRAYMTDDLAHTLLDLAKLHVPGFSARRSIVNSSFQPKARPYAGLDYDTDLKPPLLKAPEKMWVHRVNSLEKLRAVSRLFNGVELDVVANVTGESVTLDVRHPPAGSIGLSLERYFASSGHLNLHYWLDIKNLTIGNADMISRHLELLLRRYSIARERLIVESTEIVGLDAFTQLGYYTSYYLPAIESADQEHQIESLSRDIDIHTPSAISFPSDAINFADQLVLGRESSLDLLTWHISNELTPRDIEIVSQLMGREDIKVVLMHYGTDYDR